MKKIVYENYPEHVLFKSDANTPEIKAEVQRWVKALLSGKYEQGDGVLCRNEHFCCLGVYVISTDCSYNWIPGVKDDKLMNLSNDSKFTITGILSPLLANKVGLPSCSGIIKSCPAPYGFTICDLTTLNDGGWTFIEIGNLIKLFWKNQFGESLL